MGLLSVQDEATLKEHLSVITLPVQLVLFTQTIGGSESGDVARQILRESASLNDKVTVVEKSFVLDTDDTKKDADPVLLIADKAATKLNVTVMMEDCGAKTCAFGIGLYEQPLVWPDGPPKQ